MSLDSTAEIKVDEKPYETVSRHLRWWRWTQYGSGVLLLLLLLFLLLLLPHPALAGRVRQEHWASGSVTDRDPLSFCGGAGGRD
jgi:hypothetical protein